MDNNHFPTTHIQILDNKILYTIYENHTTIKFEKDWELPDSQQILLACSRSHHASHCLIFQAHSYCFPVKIYHEFLVRTTLRN